VTNWCVSGRWAVPPARRRIPSRWFSWNLLQTSLARPSSRFFATDLNDALLEKARHGLYTKSLVADVSPERLRRFFFEEQSGFRISKALREMCVFARQKCPERPAVLAHGFNQLPQLAHLHRTGIAKKNSAHLPLCAQTRRISVSGASESVGGFANLFEPVDKKQKNLFQKN